MKPLYTENEFKSAKSREKLPLQCESCEDTFYRTKHDIQTAMLPHRSGTSNFCSKRCSAKRRRPSPVMVSCEQCRKQFKRFSCYVRKRNFCSKSCSMTWRNLHKKHGTRRSKLEKWLEEQLTVLYPDLEIHFNRKDAIESELDIFIPSLMLAFELNGIFHYEPIHGQDKLDKILNNDHRKMLACAEREIEMCVIDNSSLKYFKPKSAQKFLKIVQDIIDARLSDS